MKVRCLFLAVLFCACGITAGDGSDDSLVIAAAVENPPGQKMKGTPAAHKGRRNLMLFVYERFISSQDGSTCCFSQSCSEYFVAAIRERGAVKSMLLTADRLTRCNGVQPDRYETDSLSGKNIDDIPFLVK